MKITKITAQPVGIVIPRDPAPAPRRNWIIVRVETDEGIVGLGEATTENCEHAVMSMVNEHYGPYLVGKDPTRITRLWEEMQRLFWWRGGVVTASAASGIEQALWDITGKAYGQPVYKLLGGAVRDRVRLYARNDLGLENEVAEVQAAIKEGFTGFKTGPGPYFVPYDEDKQVDVAIGLFRKLRETAGPDFSLMIDCLGNFSLHNASRLIQGIRDLGLLFVEEPVNVDNPRSFVELRRAFPEVRIAAGERLYTRWGVREWLESAAVDVLQVDVTHCGGIGELMRIAAYAEVHNVKIAPHNPYGPVALAAYLHACAAMPNFLILEHWRYYSLFSEAQQFGPRVEDGCIQLNDRPGLGVELNWDFVAKHPYHDLYKAELKDRDGGMALV